MARRFLFLFSLLTLSPGCVLEVAERAPAPLPVVESEIVSHYTPSERARANECYPLEIFPEDVTAAAHRLARNLVDGGEPATERELRRCLDGAFIEILPDDETFEEICGGDGNTYACTFGLDAGPERMGEDASYYVALRWDMTLVPFTWSNAVLRHEMMHVAYQCIYGTADGNHDDEPWWIRYEDWTPYDRDPDGDGVPGCQSTCGGCR